MIKNTSVPYLLENMQPGWLNKKEQWSYRVLFGVPTGLLVGLLVGLPLWVSGKLLGGLFWLLVGLFFGVQWGGTKIEMVDSLKLDWKRVIPWLIFGLIFGLVIGVISSDIEAMLMFGLFLGLITGLYNGVKVKPIYQTIYPGRRLSFSIRNYLLAFSIGGLITGFFFGFNSGLFDGLVAGFISGAF